MTDPRETVVHGTSGSRSGPAGGGDLTDELVATSTWTDEMVRAAGIPMVDVPFVTVGGGMGSLTMVDYLCIAGVAADDIAVLSAEDAPSRQYASLCANSQIPPHERLRSDSGSTPDNIWGFPAYALREAWHERTLRPLVHVLVEPVLRPYWTPRAGTMFAAVDREARRIGWWESLHTGQVRMVRRRWAGGYFTILTRSDESGRTTRVAFRSRYVHLAVGYPALRFLPDLEKYRETYGDYTRVVNAYEPHEHIYEALRAKPGVVMVRGAGIVASRILQRLIEDRDEAGAETTIRHLFRTYRTNPKSDRRFGWGKQRVADGWAHQGFNTTKAAWGGQHRHKLLRLDPERRAEFHEYLSGGAHTPVRRDWKEQLARGKAEGFYRQHVGQVEEVVPGDDGQSVVTAVRDSEGHLTHIPADYVIDCTGLIGNAREHRVLADLLEHAGAELNRSGRLACDERHEVTGTASPPGRLYAAGAASDGNFYSGSDSFLGLQNVAQLICDDLAAEGFCHRIGPVRSTRQWFRWVRHRPP
jgi:hypothetical protein